MQWESGRGLRNQWNLQDAYGISDTRKRPIGSVIPGRSLWGQWYQEETYWGQWDPEKAREDSETRKRLIGSLKSGIFLHVFFICFNFIILLSVCWISKINSGVVVEIIIRFLGFCWKPLPFYLSIYLSIYLSCVSTNLVCLPILCVYQSCVSIYLVCLSI